MSSLEYCFEHAPELAQEIVNAWATSANAAHADDLTPDFKVVLEQASEYLALRHDMALRRESYSRKSNDPANDKDLQAFLEEDAPKERVRTSRVSVRTFEMGVRRAEGTISRRECIALKKFHQSLGSASIKTSSSVSS